MSEQWCPVCKTYHANPGVKTDAGALVTRCPVIPATDPRNQFENFPATTAADRTTVERHRWAVRP